MPELPEVETLIRELQDAGLCQISIESVEVYWPGCLENHSSESLREALSGISIACFRRRAKYLIWEFSNGDYLHIHLRMTGRVTIKQKSAPLLPHEHLVIGFSDGRELRFHDTRKFGRIVYTKNLDALEAKLGPEPLDETWNQSQFQAAIKLKSRQLKALLLDQRFIAGLGNIYVDEALWEACLHPLRSSSTLSLDETNRLFDAIRTVLKRGLERGGTTLGRGTNNFYRLDGKRGEHQLVMNVFRRTGEPCPRCGHLIEKIIVAQRSTHYCQHCQH